MTPDFVQVSVMRFISRFRAEEIVARASTANGQIMIGVTNAGFAPGCGGTYPGSIRPIYYTVAKYDEPGEKDPLYQPLVDTLTNEEYSTEMKILRINMIKQKGDAL